jgi:uncharacterized protein involved in outer membrane biogenesis
MAGMLVVVVLAILVGLVWHTPSGLARWLVIRQIAALTGRPATIEQLDLDLLRGRLAIAGLRLAEREPGPPVLELDRLEVRFAPRALLRGHAWIHDMALDGIRIRIIRSMRGEFNIADLLTRRTTAGRSTPFTVDRLALRGGMVSLEDRTRAPVHTWRAEDIALDASGLSTSRADARGTGRLTATVAGAPVSVDVSDLQLAPLHLRAAAAVKGADVTLAGLYIPADAPVGIEDARLTAELTATVDARDGTVLDARGRLDDLTLRSRRTGEPFATVPALALTVNGARADAAGRVLGLGRIEVTGGATLFDARGAATGRLEIERLQLRIADVDGVAPASARMTITAALPGGGSLDVEGPLRLASRAAELRVRVARLDPAVLVSYAALPVDLSGVAEADLTLDLAYPGALATRVRGRVALSRVTVAGAGRPLGNARQIEVTGVDARWPHMAIARVRVVQPAATVERDATGHVPLAAPFTAARSGAGKGSGAAAGAPSGPTVEVGEIGVEDGTLTIADGALAPPLRLTLSSVGLSLRDVTWPARRPASIDLRAASPEAGTLEAKGTLSLDPARIDVRARVAGASLAPYQRLVPFPAQIQGSAHADLSIVGSLGPSLEVRARGRAALSDLTMRDGDRRVMRVSRVETTGLDYIWPATLAVDRLHVGRSRVRIERLADGTFPLRALFTPTRPPSGQGKDPQATRAGSAQTPPLSVTVREALLEEGGARLIDGAVSPPTSADLSAVRLVARDFAWPARAPTAIELQATTPNGGSVRAQGQLDLARRGADVKVTLRGVDVAQAQPYLPVSARIAGRATADLQIMAQLDPLAVSARGTAALGDLALGEGDRPILKVARVETTGLEYTWPATVTVSRLHVQRPEAAIERRRDGTVPLVALFTAARASPVSRSEGAATEPARVAPLVTIRESVLEDGSMTLTDATVSPAARLGVTGARAEARDIVWPARGPTSVQLSASVSGGGRVSAQGRLTLAPVALDLDVVVDGIDVAASQPYILARGRMAGKADARLKVSGTLEPLALSARGTAALENLTVAEGERRLLTAERVESSGLDYTWPATVSIDGLRLQKPWTVIDRTAGRHPVLDLLASVPAARDGAPRAEPGGGGARRREASAARQRREASAAARATGASGLADQLRLSVRRSVVENGAATIIDATARPPASVDITGASLLVSDLAWPARGATPVVLRAGIPGGGNVEARGQLHLEMSRLDATVVLERADLAALQSLVPVRGRLGGLANAELQLKGTLAPLALSIAGRMAVTDASLGDGERPLVTVKGADVVGIAAEWPRGRARIERIGLREPWALVERDASGGFPILALITPDVAPVAGGVTTASSSPAGAGQPETAANVEVGALAVDNGFVRFTDRTTTPSFVEEVSRLTLSAQALGTAPNTRSEVTVGARLTGGGQLELRGVMGPVGGPLFADAEGKLSGLALNRLNPYVNALVGWIARTGSIDATMRFRIRDDRLEAENQLVIGQPEFVPSRRGDEVRKRVGVPLDLLVSLLENARREVHLSVPVTGSIASRQFDFGDAVWDAIRKAAINVLALPVSWVGKIFYTADSRIDTIRIWPVSFEPGTTRMQRGIDAHADRLATFMRQTPAIVFTMKPVMTVEDVSALKHEAVRQRIAALAREAGQPEAAGAARLFGERFPGRPAPAELAAMVDELAKAEPSPDAALRALATDRVELTQRELVSKGVDPARLRASEGAVPVEGAGPGRVEFEMTPDATAAK